MSHQTKITVEWHDDTWLPQVPVGGAEPAAWHEWAAKVTQCLLEKLQQDKVKVYATDVHISRAGESVQLFVSRGAPP